MRQVPGAGQLQVPRQRGLCLVSAKGVSIVKFIRAWWLRHRVYNAMCQAHHYENLAYTHRYSTMGDLAQRLASRYRAQAQELIEQVQA